MSTTTTNPSSGGGLSVTAAIDTTVHLLQGILAAIPQAQAGAAAAGLIGAALDKLLAVQASPTTFGQLEGLRLQKLW